MESYSDENPNDISMEVSEESEILLRDSKKNPNLRFRPNARNPSQHEYALLDRHAKQEELRRAVPVSKNEYQLVPSDTDDTDDDDSCERINYKKGKKWQLLMVCKAYNPYYRQDVEDPESSTTSLPTGVDLSEGQAEEVKPEFFGKYKRRAMAVLFVVLEAISYTLDVIGKDKWRFLLAAFILSVFGFSMTVYPFVLEGTKALTASREYHLRVIEIVLSSVQLIVTFVSLILAFLGVQNDFIGSVFPLVFAILVVVFAFASDPEPEDTNSSCNTNHTSSTSDSFNINATQIRGPIDSQHIVPEHPEIRFRIEEIVPGPTGSSRASPMAAADRQVNQCHQFQDQDITVVISDGTEGSREERSGQETKTSNHSQETASMESIKNSFTYEVAAALEKKKDFRCSSSKW